MHHLRLPSLSKDFYMSEATVYHISDSLIATDMNRASDMNRSGFPEEVHCTVMRLLGRDSPMPKGFLWRC